MGGTSVVLYMALSETERKDLFNPRLFKKLEHLYVGVTRRSLGHT